MSKILVIDDKEDNLVTISALISAMIPGCKVITVQSGAGGIRAAETESPDAILLDIRMPGMDGYETCRRLKTNSRTQHIPIIMLTAVKTDACDLVKGLDCGADAYLTKPVDEAVLTAQIRTALRVKAAEDRLRSQKDILEDTVKERTAALSRANTRLVKELEEHKKTEAALRQSEERLRGVFDASDEIIFTKNKKGVYTLANAAFAKIFQMPVDKIIGKKDENILPGDEARTIQAADRVIFETGKTYRADDILHVHGRKRIFQTTKVPLRDANKEITEICGFAKDITKQKQMVEALRESEERYRTILDSIEDAYFEVDTSGNFTFFNNSLCKTLGYSTSELMGMNYKTYMDKANARNVLRTFNQAFTSGIPSRGFDWEIIRKDGTRRHVDASVSLIRDDDGNTIGFRGVVRDITDRKKAEEENKKLEAQLHQAQKMESVGRLAGGVAHDFNNMLNVILGYAELIKEELNPGDRFFDEIVEIEKAANRSAQITSQLLAFSRKQEIRPEVIALNPFMENTKKMLGRLVGEDVEILFSPGKDLWNIKMDPAQVNQVIMNLAVNARDAMQDGGRLTIETANVELDDDACRGDPGCTPGEYVLLTMSDTGCGMDEKTRLQAFEPFFTTKEVGKGTGLGLSTVYGIIKQNKGFIYIESAPGQGTTIRIYLPRCTEEDRKDSGPIERAASPGGGTILVAEDDTMVRNLARTILERNGYTVIAVETPEEALAICEQDKQGIDLLLADVVMPGMNGKVLSEKIRRIKPDIKTLFMSGYTANAIAHRGVIERGTDFIHKPFSKSDLINKVREVMRRT